MSSSEVEDLNKRNSPPSDAGLAKTDEHPLEHANAEKGGTADADGNEDVAEIGDEGAYEDEDEEEDVDFNPLLKETPSREASSSLSSENEGFDADSGGHVTSALVTDYKATPCNPVHEYPAGDTDQGEEIVTQTSPSSIGPYQKGLNSGSSHGKSDESGHKMDDDNDLVVEELNNIGSSKNPVMNLDDDTAICMRTRARYSLASFTLDELETFLQETDDDDDLRNVDDEEEYRKFLTAVLQGGDADTENVHGDENIDDEDNDADFELELEEALESDVEEDARDEIPERVYGAVSRRPRTRQNRQQKTSAERNKKLLGQLKRPLRPLLPNALITREPFSAGDGNTSMISHAPSYLPPVNDGSINGFTLHQIGQLHCLIHEHVQLLIQVFSICVLEPSRRHIAPKFQEMISEMLRVRDHVLAWRRLPYPSFCFFPPHVHPSVPTDFSRSLVAPCINETSSVVDVWRSCSPGNSTATPDIISSSNGTRECPRIGNNPDSSAWVPYINGPVLTVLDVAPLRLVGSYIGDVYAVVQDYHRRPVGASCDTHFDKEPLFPLYNSQASAEPSDQVPRTAYSPSNMVLPSSTSDQAPKRTMASALVERAKKQSVAPVPKEIAKLAQRFYPLFNPALYPHKSPPAPVANRVLFTHAEDELLALGLMEYNTDWKAIQQRFLPCKSKHQIFVRQKNRSSSKAPENPIKAVRRMKNSPLTAEEILRIQEGLKTCKLDWMSIWKFIVPYRDPSLLPRQWRIAHGTQKSYKLDANKKAKRRLYEFRRRNCKPAASPNWDTSSEKEDNNTDKAGEKNKNGDNQADKEDEAYVHEAFLADWRPGTSNVMSKSPDLRPMEKSPPIQPLLPESSSRELLNNIQTRDFQPPISNEFQTAARSSSISQPCSRAYRARRNNHSCLVKLAPDLPPVNLPPSVRVISQSAFKSYQSGTSSKTPIFCPGAVSGVTKAVKCTPNLVPINPVKAGQVRTTPVNKGYCNPPQRNSVIRNNQVAEQNDESDLQMHPLLFQAPEDGHFQYYPLNSSSNTSTFNFLSGSPPQLNLTLFHNQRPASHAVNFLEKSLNLRKSTSSVGIDFHPLLQKSNDINCSMVGARSATLLSANQESSEDHCSQLGTAPRISHVNNSSSAASIRPIRSNEKINELDLDIHLSSPSRRQKTRGIRDVNERDMAGPAGSALDSRRLGSQKTKDSFKDSSQYTPAACTPDRTISKLNSSVRALDVSGGGKSRSNVDNIEDQSLPEIVMEQEELSDSEDEIGENVEFECEEMADSEGEEGYDSEPITDIQNEEMETAATSANLVGEQCEPNAGGNPDDRVTGTSKDHKRDRKLGNSSRSSCLNLNSHPPVSPTEKNIEVSKQIRSSGSRNQATLPPEQVQNLNSGITPSEKPRKRARNKDSSIDRSRSKRRKSGLNEDMNSSSSKHVSEDEPGKF